MSMPSRKSGRPRARLQGAIIVRSIDGASSRVEAKTPPAGYVPPQPTDADRALVRALLRAKGRA
jgi:uncharacterized protein (DUF427 family)